MCPRGRRRIEPDKFERKFGKKGGVGRACVGQVMDDVNYRNKQLNPKGMS
jgi:hypothetical protein